MTKFFNSVITTLLISTTSAFAQVENNIEKPNTNPPINMESMAGSRGVMFQLLVNKKFQSIPKLGFFSVTNATAAWEKEMTPNIMTQAHFTYNLFKGLDLSSGMQYTPVYGFRPVAGLIYSYATQDILIILNPKVDLADDLATESLALLEYKPKINDKLNFYSRLQGMYGFIPESGIHNRSYIMLRAGLGYKEFAFGAASNFDWYGPIKHNENNFGVFVSALLF
ncbi:hypothetical protein [Flavobacterium johnsoniae]|uniref:Outer membrane protein beta-barrel domain-containing protein n=1 Tax=Flavobacterium johnsoniae TaxID=986 RepID=A0A1M5QUI9_FLAJO|nr:hypothetical protein [Flavobacterium johnsoniae]SHH17536.1 hypothetical protein SAMN05444388_107166 [Flavobacterium johnsoniae]